MTRQLDEWIGATPDTQIPMRVKLRILLRQGGKCTSCTRKFDPKLRPEFDHRPALINGGENRESKIFAVCRGCHSALTKADVAEKSKVYALKTKHLGIRKRSTFQTSRSGPFKMKMDGTIIRRGA